MLRVAVIAVGVMLAALLLIDWVSSFLIPCIDYVIASGDEQQKENHSDYYGCTLAAIASFIVAIFTGTLWLSSEKMWRVTTISADAAERTSVSGRAYLFLIYDWAQHPEVESSHPHDKRGFTVKIRYSIKNLGSTPGLITNVEAHLLIHPKRQFIFEFPEPYSPDFLKICEDSSMQMPSSLSPLLFPVRPDDPPILIAAQEEVPTEQHFIYHRDVPRLKNIAGSWFYCVVTYREIFTQKDRHTVYCARLVAGAHLHPKYNRWG
jgi:hypothetical protein